MLYIYTVLYILYIYMYIYMYTYIYIVCVCVSYLLQQPATRLLYMIYTIYSHPWPDSRSTTISPTSLGRICRRSRKLLRSHLTWTWVDLSPIYIWNIHFFWKGQLAVFSRKTWVWYKKMGDLAPFYGISWGKMMINHQFLGHSSLRQTHLFSIYNMYSCVLLCLGQVWNPRSYVYIYISSSSRNSRNTAWVQVGVG